MKPLLYQILIILLLAGCATRPGPGREVWQPFDQAPVLEELQSHPNSRMQLRLINSRVLDKNALWQVFNRALDNFSPSRYEALKPAVLHKSFAQLQQAVSERQFNYEQLALFYLYRIREIESDNSRSLNALIATNPNLLVEAREKDRQRAANPRLPEQYPLFGLPILVKDNIGVAGMPTTAGAIALQHNMTADATIIRQLQAAGALVLGKASLSEWAYFFCSGCPLGYSAVGGQTMNPFGRLVLETGGSSAGSGVGVAADYAAGAIGTETAGSILSPSSLNALVGLKPGTGSLSRNGIVPIAGLFDTPGPMVRSVADAIVLFNALAGYDPADAGMDAARAGLPLQAAPADLAGVKLGYMADWDDDVLYRQTLDLLRVTGAELVLVDLSAWDSRGFSELLGAEMTDDLPAYLEAWSHGVDVKSMEDVVAFNREDPEVRAPYGQALFDSTLAMAMPADESEDLYSVLQQRAALMVGPLFDELGISALLSRNNVHASLAAVANLPALTLPMGLEESGSPAGLTLLVPTGEEQRLVSLGLAIEALLPRAPIAEGYP